IQPVSQGVMPGSPAILRIELRNASNNVVSTTRDMGFVVTAKLPSGAEQELKVQIPANSSSAVATIKVTEAGLSKLEVRESSDRLISGSNYLLVSQPAQTQKPAPKKSKSAKAKAKKSTATRPQEFWPGPRLVFATYSVPLPKATFFQGPAAPQSSPGVMLTVSGEGDGKVRADGISAARVSVFLLSPQNQDVTVWLQVSHGKLASQPLMIRKGEVEAHVDWTSTVQVDEAKVWINTINPVIPGKEAAVATVQFSDPIVAIVFANPPAKMSIVELATIAVRFINQNGTPVQAHVPVRYRFSADSPRVRLNPITDQTKPGDPDFSTSIIPAALGVINIEAAVPGYQPVRWTIEVTGLLLLVFCVLGGALGGLVNHFDMKQKGLIASLLTGIIVALPITWAYVWLGLPNINSAIFHNQLSAVMVAIIAGVSGATGLRKVSKRLGFDLFDGKQEPAAN
ncbi:MAG TPA: hypothetical protein VEW69_06745, partial [Alphaproteobacteria bacterium]|nr:hypothetical protein [Alphaproteobacteria bacterium]